MSGFEDVPIPGLESISPVTETRTSTSAVPFNPELPITDEAIKRFNSFVVKSPACWFWTGSISSPDGYGRFTWQVDKQQRTLSAHRFALIASGVDLSGGLVAEHVCNEPLCVRCSVDHVRATSQSANIAYAVALGRHNGNALTLQSQLSRVERSRAVRESLKDGWDAEKFRRAVLSISTSQQSLF